MALSVRKYEKQTTINAKVDSATTVSEGKLYGINSSGNVVAAAKTTGAVVNAVGFAVRDAAGANSDYVALAMVGVVDGFTGLTPGATYYLSTAGGVTVTRPTTAGDSIQAVGTALSATKIAFNIQPAFVAAQAAGTTTLG